MTAEHLDRAAIEEILITRDVDAFLLGDWDAHAADFDGAAFTGYDGSDPGGWRLAYPTLDAYRDEWLRQSRALTEDPAPDLRAQLLSAATLERIEIVADRALVRKVFDAEIRGKDGIRALDWETFYFLRRTGPTWKITGFVGYLPRGSGAPIEVVPSIPRAPRIRAHMSTQHSTAGPYRPVLTIEPGPLVVLSGQGPLGPDGGLIGDTIEAQTTATLANCRAQLEAAGTTLTSVFKVNAYLANLDDWPAFNVAYTKLMPPWLPVRTTVGVRLLSGMLVEIEMWAAPEREP